MPSSRTGWLEIFYKNRYITLYSNLTVGTKALELRICYGLVFILRKILHNEAFVELQHTCCLEIMVRKLKPNLNGSLKLKVGSGILKKTKSNLIYKEAYSSNYPKEHFRWCLTVCATSWDLRQFECRACLAVTGVEAPAVSHKDPSTNLDPSPWLGHISTDTWPFGLMMPDQCGHGCFNKSLHMHTIHCWLNYFK